MFPRWWLATCSLLVGCGVYDYDLGTRTEGVTVDPGPPFSTPTLVVELSDPVENDDDPTLTADLLEIYFSSRREGGLGIGDIYRSRRASVDDPWEEPVPVEELNTSLNETTVAIAPDGLTMWLSSDREGGLGGTDVYVVRRADRDSSWSEPAPVEAVNTPEDEIVSSVTPGGDLLIAAREDVDETPFDLYIARQDGAGSFLPPEPVSELNTASNESDAFLADDDRLVYYTSSAGGEDDIVVAWRPDPDTPFTLVQPLDELNSTAPDRDPWLSRDQRFIIFASRRVDDQDDLYIATR